MTIPDATGEAWAEARARSPLRHYGNWHPQWFEYWDGIATQCRAGDARPRGLEREIVRHMRQLRMLAPGDRVLDIGCGAGTFALPFARVAAAVTGIDPSEAMLSRTRRAAAREGIDSLSMIRTTWEEYDPPVDGFDLVFAAFCPGIYDGRTLLKMERASARSCCYLAGDVSHFHLLGQLWSQLSGESYSCDAWDIAYPVCLLRAMGRDPIVRSFRCASRQVASSNEVIDEFVRYFRSFVDLRQGGRKKIRRFVEDRSFGGLIDLGRERTIWTVSWEVPGQNDGIFQSREDACPTCTDHYRP
ncbi:MAG TPA: methyltransferase domain-containing protein [Methanocella sp.]|nr:methyltransferase domain-containing protein [Methanocella sp.]